MADIVATIEKAQSRMLFKHLFFATLLLGTPMIETTRVPRAATNMKVIFWNRAFFESLPFKVIMFVLAHEMLHIALKHGLRKTWRDADIWNMACDYVINYYLEEAGFELWQGCLRDKRFDGMYEEQVYAILEKEAEAGGQGEGDPGEGDGDSDAPGSGKPKGNNRDTLHGDLTDIDMPTDPAERAKMAQEIDRMIAQAATMARQAGQMPAGLDLLVEGIINPPQPWLALFVDYMRRLVSDEETWSRRNRRITDFVLPSRRNPGMGPVGLIGDTSGSMLHYNVFPQVGEEIQTMCEMARPEFVQVIWADDEEASNEERFEPGDQIILHPRGGGGTDMRKPLKKMEEYEVDICVLVTDAETPFPDQPTPFPLIVLTTTNEKVPSWATRIQIR